MNTPPIEFAAIKWIKEHINSKMVVFEYGSGSSTLFFAHRVKEIISVECYPERYCKNEGSFNNSTFLKFTSPIRYVLIEPIKDETPFPYSHESFGSVDKNYEYHNFKDYVEFIKSFRNKYFDIVFINGRSRASCIRTSVPKIKSGGFLILNDSERYEYQDAIELFLKKYPHRMFGEGIRKTGIWTIL